MAGLTIRPAGPGDQPAVAALLAGAMGRADDDRFLRLLEWKHDCNPFGRSAAWVAEDDDEVVGYRTFMRWRFTDGERSRIAVRAVDTATHPSHQGRGIFKSLTLHGLEALAAEGVGFVFNTPNDNSRPGYLKMGWQLVGHLRPWMRPRGLTALPVIARSRAASSHWGEPLDVGRPAIEVFDDDSTTAELVQNSDNHPAGVLRTDRSPAYLRWRYEADLLGYRVLSLGRDVTEGTACFRVRSRGAAREAAVGDVLVPGGDAKARRRLLTAVLRETGAHYLLVLDGSLRDRLVPVPESGPTLVWRSVREDEMPPRAAWALTLGDIELF